MKNQSGVALVVALMITVIIGIMAISLAGLAYRSQKSSNLSYENVVSELNAFTGVNRVITFLNQVVDDKEKSSYLTPGTSLTTPVNHSWKIKGKTANDDLPFTIFNGIDQPMDKYGTVYLNFSQGQFWYRTPDGWNINKNCANCISLNNGMTVTRIEKRGFAPLNAGGSATKVGYNFYRITSRGSDTEAKDGSVSLDSSQSIVQTNFGLLGTK